VERIVLTVILIAAVAALARIVWKSVRSAGRAASPACRGCPLAGECNGRSDSSGRVDGADDAR
jgi:hypothetical protein